MSPPELAMVLGHELAHIRRGDLLWGLAAAGVRAVFFFHPLVWLSQRRLNLAQEVAADELAILRQHGDPASYGKLLVSVISKIGPSRLIPTMSMGTAGSVQSLTRRLVAMANIGRASRGIIVCSVVLLVATVLLGIVPWRLVAAEPKVSGDEKEPPKVALPAYRIEPPDVIGIEMPRVIPLPSYRATVQPVTGQYLVGPDGTINLRKYGVVHISGKTVVDARIAVQNHLKQYLDAPELSVKVVAYNSNVYYMITRRADRGDNGSSSTGHRRGKGLGCDQSARSNGLSTGFQQEDLGFPGLHHTVRATSKSYPSNGMPLPNEFKQRRITSFFPATGFMSLHLESSSADDLAP